MDENTEVIHLEGASFQADTETLPLVVWLKGDEPYLDAFSLDADAAMAELGIKRSRLTQISGKELRVGRLKMGRYVRPVYRPEDITEYLSWSRATATSKRSSSMVEEAADKLGEHADKISEAMSKLQDNHLEKMGVLIGGLADKLFETERTFTLQSEEERLRLFERLEKQHTATGLRMDEIRNQIESQNTLTFEIEKLNALGKGVSKTLDHVKERVEQKELHGSLDKVYALQEELTKGMAFILRYLETVKKESVETKKPLKRKLFNNVKAHNNFRKKYIGKLSRK